MEKENERDKGFEESDKNKASVIPKMSLVSWDQDGALREGTHRSIPHPMGTSVKGQSQSTDHV